MRTWRQEGIEKGGRSRRVNGCVRKEEKSEENREEREGGGVGGGGET